MAEIIRGVGSLEAHFSYPMRELKPKSQAEVYEAVGEHLDNKIMNEDKKVSSGAFLVRLESGVEVVFEHGLAKSSAEDRNEIIFYDEYEAKN